MAMIPNGLIMCTRCLFSMSCMSNFIRSKVLAHFINFGNELTCARSPHERAVDNHSEGSRHLAGEIKKVQISLVSSVAECTGYVEMVVSLLHSEKLRSLTA